MKKVGWALALGLFAGLLGVLIAPQVLFAFDRVMGGTWAPVYVPLRYVAFELGLWGIGLGVAWLGRRFNWIVPRSSVLLVTAAPMLTESALALMMGRLPAGFSTWLASLIRLVVGGFVSGVAWGIAVRAEAGEAEPP